MPQSLILVLCVVFFSSFARSAVGFGNALVAMPLLTLLLGIRMATPLVGLLAVALSAVILLGSWREVDLSSAWRLVLASFAGMPLGLWLIHHVPAQVVAGGLGLLLIGFGIYSLLRPVLPMLQQTRWVYLAGGLAGALGAAYNTNGPPVVIYGALRHWTPTKFRATLQGFFLPSTLAISGGHALSGLWNQDVFVLFGASLPVMLAAIWVGGWVNHRIEPERFLRLLYVIVIGLGVLLLFPQN